MIQVKQKKGWYKTAVMAAHPSASVVEKYTTGGKPRRYLQLVEGPALLGEGFTDYGLWRDAYLCLKERQRRSQQKQYARTRHAQILAA